MRCAECHAISEPVAECPICEQMECPTCIGECIATQEVPEWSV